MEIGSLGHSCFRLKGATATVITDPYPSTFINGIGNPEATLVTVSNDHPNHSHQEVVQGDPIIINGPGEYEVSHVYLKGLRTRGLDESSNTVFLIEMDGLIMCHLGDLAEPLSARQIEQLSATNILFLPVGQGCTLPMPQAVECISLIQPKIVIPMHYRIKGQRINLDPLDAFLKEMGLKEIQPQAKISVTPSNLPQETSVVVLERTEA